MSVYRYQHSQSSHKAKGSLQGYKPFQSSAKEKNGESLSKFSKYSQQLISIQQMTENVQSSLNSYQKRAAELTKRNQNFSNENAKLRRKIEALREPPKPKPFELFSPSNTSLRTQETEVVQSHNGSISVSSCSSTDSIMILKEQVEHVKEFKHVKRAHKQITIHRKTNSIGSSKDADPQKPCESKQSKPSKPSKQSKPSKPITQSSRRNPQTNQNSRKPLKAFSIMEPINSSNSLKHSLVHTALLSEIPVLRFN